MQLGRVRLLPCSGRVVAGLDLEGARNAIEEFEATARLALLLRGTLAQMRDPGQVAELVQPHDIAWQA